MKFRTSFDRVRVFCSSGSPFLDTYKLKVQENGKTDLTKVGKINIYEEIQSHKDSVDLHLTLERFAKGEIDSIDKRFGSYGDFTNMPQNYMELCQRVVDAENFFHDLPVDVRREFDHDPSLFFSSIGTEKFNSIYDKYYGTAMPETEADKFVKEVEDIE